MCECYEGQLTTAKNERLPTGSKATRAPIYPDMVVDLANNVVFEAAIWPDIAMDLIVHVIVTQLSIYPHIPPDLAHDVVVNTTLCTTFQGSPQFNAPLPVLDQLPTPIGMNHYAEWIVTSRE